MKTPDWCSRFKLLATHGLLNSLIDNLTNGIQSGDPWLAQPMWVKLETLVVDHVEAEERDLLGEYAAAHPIEAARIRKDHEKIRAKLAELGVRIELHTVGEAEVTALGRMLGDHASYEERTIYQWACTHPPQADRTPRARLRRKHPASMRWRGSEPPR